MIAARALALAGGIFLTAPSLAAAPLIQRAELTASDQAAGDELGNSVAVSASTIVVGVPAHRGNQGVVYVYSEPSSGHWKSAHQTAELTAADGAADDNFGASVAVDGSAIVVGAPGHGSGGAVYVFQAPASGQWRNATQTAELTASDPTSGDQLGGSVAISGSTIAAGAPEHEGGQGAAYVFQAPASGQWHNATQTAELVAADGTAGDELGYSTSISGATIAAGAPSHGAANQGAVYSFSAPAPGQWQGQVKTAELRASDGRAGDQLGASVAVSGSTVATGAPLHAVGSSSEQGAVYVWHNATQTAELTASDGNAGDGLGYSLAITDSTIAVGAPERAAGTGATYLFAAPWHNATQTSELTSSDGTAGDEFGYSVGVSGTTIAGGSPGHEGGGSSYVFSPAMAPLPPLTLTDVKQSHSTWRAGTLRARVTRTSRPKLPVGTTFSFALNQPAYVSFGFSQHQSGRTVGRQCVKPTSKNERRRPCDRVLLRGSLAFVGHPGTNAVYFDGILARGGRLHPGRYTLTILAVGAAQATSRPRRLSFTIANG